MDFLFNLPTSESGKDGLLVVVDRLSRSVVLIPVSRDINAEQTATLFFENVVRKQGVPKRIVCDRDTRFMGEFWTNLMKNMGTTLLPSTTAHPETNGLTERTNRSILQVLRCLCHEKGGDWERWIPHVELAYNSAVHNSTGVSPFELDKGYEPRLPLNLFKPQSSSPFVTWTERLVEAREHMREAQNKQKKEADKRRRQDNIEEGSWVYLNSKKLARTARTKLDTPFIGPYRVIKNRGNYN
eukprot:Gregarina_sp_Poly_1__4092@NODE_2245_length_2417_cov_121_274468_g1441_i0_p2_GENE_NODE_2245_length_2417_cov_121_274468_g1441_i0NODE_2245_length_2417_cov_121_274468_g1441_i0_p2_ORF_typecomplete_len241_score6_16rve/PF00665_26/1_1e21DDE_2/PF02914_15/0_00083_NODE_2245_length_2417_cov_121_274468_g1441_i014662188